MQRPLASRVLDPFELPDLIECVNGRGKTAVHAENLTFNDGYQRHVLKQFEAHLIHVRIAELPQAFVVKAVIF